MSKKSIWASVAGILLLGILLVILGLGIAVYRSDKILFETAWPISTQLSMRIRNKALKILEFKRHYTERQLAEWGYDVYNLVLTPDDQKFIQGKTLEARRAQSNVKFWRKVDLQINGKKYKAKMRFHGDRIAHFSFDHKSYTFKLKEGENPQGLNKFALILWEDTLAFRSLGTTLAKQKGLMDIRGATVALQINGKFQGLYYLQEKFDQDLLKANHKPGGVIFTQTDESKQEKTFTWFAGHNNPFSYEISAMNLSEGESSYGQGLKKLNQLFEMVHGYKEGDLKELLEPQRLLTFEALRAILGNQHIIAGDNLRYVYDEKTGKIEFLPNFETITALQSGITSLREFEQYLNSYGGHEVALFSQINRDDAFRLEKYRLIYQWCMDEAWVQDVLARISQEEQHIERNQGNISRREMRYLYQQLQKNIQFNIAFLKEQLAFIKLYVNVIQEDERVLKVELLPDSISFLKLEALELALKNAYSGQVKIEFKDLFTNQVKQKDVSISNASYLNLDLRADNWLATCAYQPNMTPLLRRYQITLHFDQKVQVKDSVQVKAINAVTGQVIDDQRLLINQAV